MNNRVNNQYIEQQKRMEEEFRMKTINNQLIEIEQNHPELLIPGDLVFIKIKVNNVEIPAMIDSGAQESVISLKTCRECNLEHQIDYRRKKAYQGVGRMSTIGTIYIVPMMIGKTYCMTTLNVFGEESPMDHLLIGTNTLRQLGISIDFKKECIRIGEEEIKFLTNTDVNYILHKPFHIPPVPEKFKEKREQIHQHLITIEDKNIDEEDEIIYKRYDDLFINEISLCGLDEYQSMDLLDLTGGNVKEALNMRNLNLSL